MIAVPLAAQLARRLRNIMGEFNDDEVGVEILVLQLTDYRRAHLTQPAQSVDIEAIREVIESHINEAKNLRHDPESQDYLYEQADKLEAAIKGVA